jgi:hypothetical protein
MEYATSVAKKNKIIKRRNKRLLGRRELSISLCFYATPDQQLTWHHVIRKRGSSNGFL